MSTPHFGIRYLEFYINKNNQRPVPLLDRFDFSTSFWTTSVFVVWLYVVCRVLYNLKQKKYSQKRQWLLLRRLNGIKKKKWKQIDNQSSHKNTLSHTCTHGSRRKFVFEKDRKKETNIKLTEYIFYPDGSVCLSWLLKAIASGRNVNTSPWIHTHTHIYIHYRFETCINPEVLSFSLYSSYLS